jgi:NAD(P)-dependent dehydrogenase (short-subunit alcohol dehydrogenase family)
MGAEQKVAVITGASQGIGAALVKAYLDRNYRVVATARSVKPTISRKGVLPMQAAKLVITAASMSLATVLAQPADAAGSHDPQKHTHASVVVAVADQTKVNATKAALRDLWIGHVFWVRNVVVAGLASDATAQQTAEKQVVGNAQSIAGSIEPFYGAKAKEKLFALLAGHYGAVKAYLDASIAKDAGKQSEASTKLMSNAGEIASFLSTANPYLPKDTVEELFQEHGGHHMTEIQQLQARDFAGEAHTWADMTQHMYVIADALAGAIAKQFAAKF